MVDIRLNRRRTHASTFARSLPCKPNEGQSSTNQCGCWLLLEEPTAERRWSYLRAKSSRRSSYARTPRRTTSHPSTRPRLGVFKNHINPAFGKLKLDEIRGMEIERFKARKLAEGMSPQDRQQLPHHPAPDAEPCPRVGAISAESPT